MTEEFTVTHVLQYQESSHPKVGQAGIQIRTWQKWKARDAVDFSESRLRQRAIADTVVQGRASLGRNRTPHYEKANGKNRRLLILEEVQAGVEEEQASWTMEMQQ